MIVEIIGLPCVGKTLIINELRKNHNYQGKLNFISKKKCRSRIKSFEVFKFFLRVLFFYPKIILDFRSSFWLLSKISLRLSGDVKNITKEICILNESGVLMPIISFIVQWNKLSYEIDLSKIIRTLPLPDVVVFIDSDIDTIVDRCEHRGGVKMYGQKTYPVVKSAKLYKQFLLGRGALLNLQDALKKKNCTVITIDNNVKCEKVAFTIFHELTLQLNSD
jgi:hypothetical protein